MSSEYCCLMNDLEFNQDGDLNLKNINFMVLVVL